MTLDSIEKEFDERANGIAKDKIQSEAEDFTKRLQELHQETKDAKKALRRKNKQLVCQHEFKIKTFPTHDHLKCRKCKFEFDIDVSKDE